jgi:hypothetical protein
MKRTLCIFLKQLREALLLPSGHVKLDFAQETPCVLQLRMQRERVEQFVDEVVQSYHNGFNKAIHNYSRILHLFSESKEQVWCC